MISEKDWKKIGENPLFDGVDLRRAREILVEAGGRSESFADGDVILSPHSDEKAAGILLSGSAVVTTPDPSKNTLLRYLGVGEPFGIANLFCDAPYISLIRAHGSARVFLMPERAIKRLLEEDHAFLYQYLGFLSGRIRYLNRKIGYLTAGSAERRLALYLASLGKETVRLSESISALSDLLDVGRASLYRAFDKLTDDGFIAKDGRTIHLLDIDGMLAAYQ
ncbi:MAG: Crp/Fnr family transcriptional regulator [Clostridia bacterium]|nr:Crp/Fnr family transcriptional regulator [Clostridia bacterium]